MKVLPVDKEEWILMLEHKISDQCFSCSSLVDAATHRHLEHGFAIRLYMLQASRMFFEEMFSKNRNRPLGSHEATLSALHANAFYVGVRGALDNLAWALQFKFSLFDGVNESEGDRAKIDLFRECFVKKVEERLPVSGRKLRAKKDLAGEFKRFRDPAAHRIPIFVPPDVIKPRDFEEIVKTMERENSEASGSLIPKSNIEIKYSARTEAVMILGGEHLIAYPLFTQIKKDYWRFLAVSRATICQIQNQC